MSRGGTDLALRHDAYTADLTTIGAGLRTLRHDGRDLVVPYAADEVRPAYRGALLAPWPNRVADGRYTFEGSVHELCVNELERRTALHGLVAWERFDVAEQTAATVTLLHRLVPRTGYPFELELTVRYALGEGGLTTTVSTRNLGSGRAPYGVAPHPYLRAGAGRVDDWVLEVPAARVLQVTPERLLPTGATGVEAAGLDFRTPRRISTARADHAFTGLVADDGGLARVGVRADDGGGVECTWDPVVLPWVQVHTADLADPVLSRIGLAVEPMTCPPDAFNSHTDLVVLEPGATHSAWWAISAV